LQIREQTTFIVYIKENLEQISQKVAACDSFSSFYSSSRIAICCDWKRTVAFIIISEQFCETAKGHGFKVVEGLASSYGRGTNIVRQAIDLESRINCMGEV